MGFGGETSFFFFFFGPRGRSQRRVRRLKTHDQLCARCYRSTPLTLKRRGFARARKKVCEEDRVRRRKKEKGKVTLTVPQEFCYLILFRVQKKCFFFFKKEKCKLAKHAFQQ